MAHPIPSLEELEALCRKLDQELRELVAAQAAGRMQVHGFVEALLRFEAERVAAHGLILPAPHPYDAWPVVPLRTPGRSAPCASFEFAPATGRFRQYGSPCRESDPRIVKKDQRRAP